VKFFLDTADIKEIEAAHDWGVLSGVTTNPSLYLRTGGKLSGFHDHVKRICDIVQGPVSAETVSLKRDEILAEAEELAALHDCVVVKIPVMPEGLAATRMCFERGIKVNMTLCFTVPQAILSARAGAAYVSPFVGRFDDISEDGVEELGNMITAIKNYDFGHEVEVIAASIRSPQHVVAAAMMGADIATVPFAILEKCVKHPLTDRGLEAFLADWKKVTEA
jgi:transaldolase